MESEIAKISRDFRLIEESFGQNVLNLDLASGYLKKLQKCAAVARHLSVGHADILAQFQKLVDAGTLESNG